MKSLISLCLVLAGLSVPIFAQTLRRSEAAVQTDEMFEKTMAVTFEKSLSAFEKRLSDLGAIISEDEVPGQKLAFVEMPKQLGHPNLFFVCIVYRAEGSDGVTFVRGEAVNVDLRKARPGQRPNQSPEPTPGAVTPRAK